MRMGLGGSLVGAVALLLAPAAHGDVWSPPRQVSTEPASRAIAAVAANGGAVVAWSARKGTEFGQLGAGPGPGPIAYVTRRARGDAFTTPVEIAANSLGPRAVGAGDDGLARLLWPRYEDGTQTQFPETPAPLAEAYGPLGGRLGDPNGTGLPRDAQVAVGRDGTAVAMWLGTPENTDHTQPVFAAWHPAGGSFGTPRALGGAFRTGSVAVDANGLGFVAWTDAHRDVHATSCGAGGCAAATTLSDPARPTDGFPPALAVNNRGDVAIGWTVGDAYPSGHTGQVVVRSGDGSFGPVREVHDDMAGVQKPQVAVDDDGNVAFLWNNGADGRASFMPAGGPAGPTETVPGVSSLEYASGFDSTGAAVVAWTKMTYPEDHRLVQAAERLRDGTWVGPQTISDVPVGEGMRYQQDPPALAFDRAGGALLTWTLAPEWQVFVADYDRRGVVAPAPVISAVKAREVSREVRVSFRLSRPASVRATLSRHKRRVSSRGVRASRGRNSLRVRAPRRAGTYRLTIVARNHGRRSTRRLRVHVSGRG